MLFPIGDTNVQGGYKPYVSYAFIGLNVLIFIIQFFSGTDDQLVCSYGTIPYDIARGDSYYTLITSMFMHGGWMHLIGNMMFLWVFADNIEAVEGNVRFILFYICGGLAASLLHIGIEIWTGGPAAAGCCLPCVESMTCAASDMACAGSIPAVGASGAISAVLGAYLVLFPKSRIKVFFFVTSFTIPALVFLGLWFAEQLISGLGALSVIAGAAGGVAWWAHIGGFLFGLGYGFLRKKHLDVSYQE